MVTTFLLKPVHVVNSSRKNFKCLFLDNASSQGKFGQNLSELLQEHLRVQLIPPIVQRNLYRLKMLIKTMLYPKIQGT